MFGINKAEIMKRQIFLLRFNMALEIEKLNTKILCNQNKTKYKRSLLMQNYWLGQIKAYEQILKELKEIGE
jgi:uncharacterized protein YcgL (UPF0745 family)